MKMWSNILVWFKGLSSWIQVLMVLITFGSVVSAALLVYKTKVITGYKEELRTEQQTTDLEETKVKLDTVIYTLNVLSDEVKQLNNNVDGLSMGQEALRQSWLSYLYTHKDVDPLTEKVFVEYMQNLGFDLKKNLENSVDKTVSDK